MKILVIAIIAVFVAPVIAGNVTIFAEIGATLDAVNALIAGR